MSADNGKYIFGYYGDIFGVLKITLPTALFVLVFCLFSCPASADTFDVIADRAAEDFGLYGLEDAVPYVTSENADKLGIDLSISGVNDIFDVSFIIKALFKSFLSALKGFTSLIATACAMSLFGFIIRELSPGVPASGLYEIVSTFSCAGLLYGNISFTVKSVKAVLDSLTGYVTAALPVTLSLMSAAGRPSLAASSGTVVYTAVASLGTVLSTFVPLFANIYFCVAIMSSVSENNSIIGISSAVKKIASGVMTFIYFIFTGIGAMGSFASHGADSLARKSIKYAAGTYIPVAGGYISDGIDIWFASVESLRNTGGIFGIAVISITVAVPLCSILAGYVATVVSGGIFSLGGSSSAIKFLSAVKDAYSLMFSLLCGYGIMLCLLFSFMMKGI